MRIKRAFPILLGVLLIAAAVAVVVVLRKHAPPEPARLLPSADGFVYVNLKWIRHTSVAAQLPPVSHEPEYEQFIQETGFQFEQDLDQAALAIHYPASLPATPSGAPQETRFSSVFVGKIDGQRLRKYLGKLSHSVESYRETNIFNIPLEGRTLRVAILSVDMVAASNHPDPAVIRGMIDRSRKLASPFGGPALLRQYYKFVPVDLPFTRLGWAVLKVGPEQPTALPGPIELPFLFRKPAVLVASARYSVLGGVHVKAEAFTASEEDAQQLADQLNTFLGVLHSAELEGNPNTDADMKRFFDSLEVKQQTDRTTLSAAASPEFLRKLVSGPPDKAAPAPMVQPSAPPAPPKRKQKVK